MGDRFGCGAGKGGDPECQKEKRSSHHKRTEGKVNPKEKRRLKTGKPRRKEKGTGSLLAQSKLLHTRYVVQERGSITIKVETGVNKGMGPEASRVSQG